MIFWLNIQLYIVVLTCISFIHFTLYPNQIAVSSIQYTLYPNLIAVSSIQYTLYPNLIVFAEKCVDLTLQACPSGLLYYRSSYLHYYHWWICIDWFSMQYILLCCTLSKDFVILQLYWWLFSSTKHCSWNMV